MNAQEAFKAQQVEQKIAEIQSLDPNALAQIAQSYQPQGMPPQGMEGAPGMEQGMPQGQPSPEEMAMMEQQGQMMDPAMQGQPPMDPAMMEQMMAQQQGAPQMPMQYGGPMSYKCGGGMYEYGGHLMDNHSYKGGGVVRAIGTGLQAAAPLVAKIPGYGTIVAAGMGGLGAGLGNVGTGGDFKEVARDVAFGAGKGAASTIPGGGALVGAAEGVVNNNVTDASEKETAERLTNDPSAAEDIAKEQRTNSLINTGVGALGSAVASTKTDDAAPAVPAAAPATPAPAMPAMPVNDAIMPPTPTTTMPVPEQPINALNKYGGSMYQYGGNLSRQFYDGGTMSGSNFGNGSATLNNPYAQNNGLNNSTLQDQGFRDFNAGTGAEQPTTSGNNGLSGGQYAQMGTAIAGGATQTYNNFKDPNASMRTKSESLDGTVQGVAGAINPIVGAAIGVGNMIGKPIRTKLERTDAQGNLENKKGAQAGAIVGSLFDPVKAITTRASYEGGWKDFSGKGYVNALESEAKQNIADQKSQEEAYNQQQLAAQQQQQNMINSAVQAGIAGYQQQDNPNSNFAKYGGYQYANGGNLGMPMNYPTYKDNAGPMGQPLTNLYNMGGNMSNPYENSMSAFEFGGDLDFDNEDDFINYLDQDTATTRSFDNGGRFSPQYRDRFGNFTGGDNNYVPQTDAELMNNPFNKQSVEENLQFNLPTSDFDKMSPAEKEQYLSDLARAQEQLKNKQVDLSMNQTWGQAAGLALPAAYNIGRGLFGKVGTLNAKDYYQTADFEGQKYNMNPEKFAADQTFAGAANATRNAAPGGGAYMTNMQNLARLRNEAMMNINRTKQEREMASAQDAQIRNKAIEAANLGVKANVDDYNIKAREAKQQTLAAGLSQAAKIAENAVNNDIQTNYIKAVAPDFAGTVGYNTVIDQLLASRKASKEAKNKNNNKTV